MGLIGLGLPASGAVAMGSAMLTVGAVFTCVGALTAQLAPTASAARGLGLVAAAVAYLLRAAGDADGRDSVLSWLSPIGWGHRVRPFAGEQWWVLLLPVGTTVALVAVAILLSARRDMGAGLFETRPGPAAAAGLRSTTVLAWRLHRPQLLGWTVGFAVFGLLVGSIGPAVGDVAQQSDQLREMLTYLGSDGSPVEAMLAMFFMLLALAAGAYAALAALRPHTEESSGRAEPLLATSVSRLRWLGGHLLVAAAGPVIILATLGLGAGLVYGSATGDSAEVLRMLTGSLVYVPATWLVVGVAVVLYGTAPHLAVPVTWTFLVLNVLVFLVSALPGIDPETIAEIAPFLSVPSPLVTDMSMTPLLVQSLIAATLVALGAVGFQRRGIG
ncbi:ABC transporter permease [Brevibacterium picturae]|uniref:ABC transporter permease n=1 Tax=Brevibacterium picturae TaxID=260553 RepID=UPI0031F74084